MEIRQREHICRHQTSATLRILCENRIISSSLLLEFGMRGAPWVAMPALWACGGLQTGWRAIPSVNGKYRK